MSKNNSKKKETSGVDSIHEPQTTLYRKYRPHTFSDVIGQDHVVSVLTKAVAHPGHAYIFSGGRGIGKTSLARIFAQEIGCSPHDLYEIDAASHTGVDDIRVIIDGSESLPFTSPYKVYILDEVHMLSKSAFNALLKTLEEPPQHVIFILATTDVDKIPDTVLSRCEVLTLQRPSTAVLTDVVATVCKKELYTIDPEAAELIAILGDGSFRDTLSLLQQVITAAEDTHISQDLVARQTGAPQHTTVFGIISGLAEGSIETVLKKISEAQAYNTRFDILTQLLIDTLRAILLVRLAPNMSTTLKKHFSEEAMNEIKTFSSNNAISSKTLRALLESYPLIKTAYAPHIILEVTCIDLLEKKS